MQRIPAILLGTAMACLVWTQSAAEPESPSNEPANLQPLPEAPDIPPPVVSGETLEPEVTIRTDDEQRVTEYRINGRLHSIKVEPVIGPTYWMVDTTGDGFVDTRYDNFAYPPLTIPGWVIFRW